MYFFLLSYNIIVTCAEPGKQWACLFGQCHRWNRNKIINNKKEKIPHTLWFYVFGVNWMSVEVRLNASINAIVSLDCLLPLFIYSCWFQWLSCRFIFSLSFSFSPVFFFVITICCVQTLTNVLEVLANMAAPVLTLLAAFDAIAHRNGLAILAKMVCFI